MLREVELMMSRIVRNPVIVSARDGLIKAPAKMRSRTHCPDVLTVYYFKTSPGGFPLLPEGYLTDAQLQVALACCRVGATGNGGS